MRKTKKIFYFYPTRTLFRYFHFKKIVCNFFWRHSIFNVISPVMNSTKKLHLSDIASRSLRIYDVYILNRTDLKWVSSMVVTFLYQSILCHGHCRFMMGRHMRQQRYNIKQLATVTATSTMISHDIFFWTLPHETVFTSQTSSATTTWESFGLYPISSYWGLLVIYFMSHRVSIQSLIWNKM